MKRKTVCVQRHSPDFYILLFFLLSFIGWLWEVGIFGFTEHQFINRGVYKGPYLPIYGVGGILLYIFLHKLHRHPIWTFLLSMVICSLVEYSVSVFLEWKWGIRWWDYSGYALNWNGRICLIGAIAFGLGGTWLNCYFMPLYMKLYHKINHKWRMILCMVLVIIFSVDAAYCAIHPNRGYGISSCRTCSLKRSANIVIVQPST